MCVSMDTRLRVFTSRFFTKFLLLCFCLFALFTLLDRALSSIPFQFALFAPKSTGFSLSLGKSVNYTTTHRRVKELRVKNMVVFTDHVLVILSRNENGPRQDGIECVYHRGLNGGYKEESNVTYPMLSADEYDEETWIVRCPTPPLNYTEAVSLQGHQDNVVGLAWVAGVNESHVTAQKWDMLAYDAVLDGEDTAAVFVKGLSLLSDRESDASYFSCYYSNFSLSDDGFTVNAITASQEIIRCPLPSPVKECLRRSDDVYVTVKRNSERTLVPSVARLRRNNGGKSGNYTYKLCACSMVLNQAGFMKEWIHYHGWLGVQRWFVYDNNSDDGLQEVINELDAENYNVSRHVWPWVKSQEAGFAHCVLRARDQCRWVGFFDVDEFYYLPPPKKKNRMFAGNNPGKGALQEIVDYVTINSTSVGEIRTHCHTFGPSGLTERPKEGVTLGYTCRMRPPERHKSIVRPDAVDDTLLNQIHHFKLKKEFNSTTLSQGVALINHYKYQVWDVFKAKFKQRVSTYVVDWQEDQSLKSNDRTPGLGTEAIEPLDWPQRFCEIWDTGLKDFIIANLADPDTGLVRWGPGQ